MSVTAIHAERLQNEYLESLAQRVRAWRFREGKSYFSMPTPLWEEAITAARKHGLRQVARDLGLNRDELKRRMGLAPQLVHSVPAGAAALSPPLEEEAQFIELPGVAAALAAPPASPLAEPATAAGANRAMDPIPALSGQPGEATVEILTADGAKLTVRIPVGSLNIASLVHDFRSRA